MKFLGMRRMAIKAMKLPGDIKDRMGRKHVKELWESIEALGGQPAEPPIVEAGTRELKVGRDRIAACMTGKVPRVDVRIAEGTPEEFAQLELDENLRRRQDDREKMLARAARLEEAAVKAAEEEKAEKAGTPVPKPATIKKQAREAVAKKAGVKPESVRKAVQRQKAKEAPPKPEKPPIDMLGRDITPGLRNVASRTKDMCETLANLSKTAQGLVSKSANILNGQVVVRLMDAAKELGAIARAVQPHSICPKCYGEGDEKCPLCKGAHYARAEQMADVPREWLKKPETNGTAQVMA